MSVLTKVRKEIYKFFENKGYTPTHVIVPIKDLRIMVNEIYEEHPASCNPVIEAMTYIISDLELVRYLNDKCISVFGISIRTNPSATKIEAIE